MKFLKSITPIFLLTLIIFLTTLSCSDENISLLEPEYGIDYTFNQKTTAINNDIVNKRSVIKITIHRPRRSCISGLGICEVCIGCPDAIQGKDNQSTNSSSIPINIKYNGIEIGLENNKYIELLLDNKLDSKFDSTFYIDEDLYFNDKLFIQKNIIKLNESVGEFGGYLIPIYN